MWQTYFKKTVLINLPARTDRLHEAVHELKKYDIPYTIVDATQHENGAVGLRETLRHLFQNMLLLGYRNLLMFEDDIHFLQDPEPVLEKCVDQLRKIDCVDLFYLGANTHHPFAKFQSPNLLPVQHAFSLHAVCFSQRAMAMLLEKMVEDDSPMDVLCERYIQPLGTSYHAYPLLATQFVSYSDIEKKIVDHSFIQTKFEHHIKHLL